MGAVGVVKGCEFAAVNVYDGFDVSVGVFHGYYDFGAREAAAGDVAGKFFDVGNDDGFALLIGRATHAASGGNPRAGHGALKRAEVEAISAPEVEACPPKAECRVDSRARVGQGRDGVVFVFYQCGDLRIELAVGGGFVHWCAQFVGKGSKKRFFAVPFRRFFRSWDERGAGF